MHYEIASEIQCSINSKLLLLSCESVVDAWSLQGFNFMAFIVCIPMLTDGSTSITFLWR